MLSKLRTLFNANTKASRASSSLVAWSRLGQPVWTPRRYDTLTEQGFRRNVVAYRCATMVAASVAQIPYVLSDANDHEITRHPLLALLQRPNPLTDRVAFLENIATDLQLTGNAYIEAVRADPNGSPTELYVLRPDRMRVIPSANGMPEGYEYSVHGRTTRWRTDPITGDSAIAHLRLFNPLDDWYGMGHLEAAMLAVDQHNAASSWNQALLNAGARPSGALVFAPREGSATLSDTQIRRLREELDTQHTGTANAGRPLILEGGLEWREISLSPKDMDWLAGRDSAARDIALAFGVPAQLIGITDAQTYANMAEARLALYEETVLPLAERIVGSLNHWLIPQLENGLRLVCDTDAVSALTARRDALWEKVQNADFLSLNEKRAALGYEPISGGDQVAE